MAKSKRGGKREGSGKKTREYHGKPPRQAFTIRVEPEIADEFRSICKRYTRSQSEQLTEWVRKAKETYNKQTK